MIWVIKLTVQPSNYTIIGGIKMMKNDNSVNKYNKVSLYIANGHYYFSEYCFKICTATKQNPKNILFFLTQLQGKMNKARLPIITCSLKCLPHIADPLQLLCVGFAGFIKKNHISQHLFVTFSYIHFLTPFCYV